MGNNANINPKGGNSIILTEVTLNPFTVLARVLYTVAAHATGTGLDLGHIKSSGYDSTPSEITEPNEAGITVYSDATSAPVTEGILMERDKVKLDFLRYKTEGRFYLQIHYQGIAGGKRQEEFSIGKLVSQKNASYPGAADVGLRYKFNKLAQTADSVISAAVMSTVGSGIMEVYGVTIYTAAVPVTILANREDVLVETAV